MSSTYLPPHMRNRRNKKDDQVPTKEISIKVTDQSFPSLGNSSVKTQSRWNGPTTFASLANNWNEDDNMRIAEAEQRKREIEYETTLGRKSTGIPSFYKLHAEDVKEQYEELDEPDQVPTDEWNAVTYQKPRKVRTAEEDAQLEELENQAQKEADDMWADEGPETHQTYWDQRY